jgi:hypothetical protein
MAQLMRLYSLLDPVARGRVHDYMTVRLDSLPVIVAVERDPEPELFGHNEPERSDLEHADLPSP